jgi:superfamily II DNA or RNA helicase
MIIYMVTSFLQRLFKGKNLNKILIVVPSVTLVDQMDGDFRDYGSELETHLIAGGISKNGDAQSLQEQPEEYFEQFRAIIVDEVHLATAKSLREITEKCVNAIYRFGFTGTLKDATTDILQLRGLFGKAIKVISLRELMDMGLIADTDIEMVRITYGKSYEMLFKYANDFDGEQSAVLSVAERDQLIFDIIADSEGKNGIVLFNFNKHGKRLVEGFKKRFPDRKYYLINGSVGREDRKEIREAIDRMTGEDRGVILFATYKTLSTGVSIKNLDFGIFAHPMKSKITIMQSLGRLLRKSTTKFKAKLWDLWDDFTEHRDPKTDNFYKRHAKIRYDYYDEAEINVRESSREVY